MLDYGLQQRQAEKVKELLKYAVGYYMDTSDPTEQVNGNHERQFMCEYFYARRSSSADPGR